MVKEKHKEGRIVEIIETTSELLFQNLRWCHSEKNFEHTINNCVLIALLQVL